MFSPKTLRTAWNDDACKRARAGWRNVRKPWLARGAWMKPLPAKLS